jgi:hypothetical protein
MRALSFAVIWLLASGIPCPGIPGVDSSHWLTGSEREPGQGLTYRQQHIDQVTIWLSGKSRSEIECELGKSLETSYFGSSKYDLIYLLGPERKLISIDSEWMLIWLDANGHFVRSQVVTD